MNKTKKAMAVGLSILAMLTNSLSVFAAEPDNKTTTLTYQVDSNYDWMIHSAIDFGADAGPSTTVERTENNQVKVLKNVIPEDYYLCIRVKNKDENGKLVLTNGKSENLLCDVGWKDKDISWGDSLIHLAAGENTATQEMAFRLNTKKGSAEVAGEYNGTVVYEAAVKKPAPSV